VIGERARLTKGERERYALIDRTAIKHSSRIGRNRMRGRVIVRPRDSGAYRDSQRTGLEASTGN